MDIKIGKIELTKEQLERSNSLKNETIKGLSVKGDEVTLVCSRDLTDQEKSKLISDIEKLSKDPMPDKESKKIGDKKDKDITLEDVVKVLRERGIL